VPAILLVKTSSLGDVISNLPVASDIARALPGARIDWLVEENFAAIPALHPKVQRVITVAWRRWRRQLLSRETWQQWARARQALREQPYDFVIDTQGLLKSVCLMQPARGLKCGYDRASIREPLAALAYHRCFAVPPSWQAVARNRGLAAQALGYDIDPHGEPDYGLAVAALAAPWLPRGPYCVLLTATSRAEKLWPPEHWVALAQSFKHEGLLSILPAGSPAERAAASAIAAQVEGAQVAPPLGLAELAGVLAGSRAVVGVDTGLTHLAAAIGRPVVGVYCGSSPQMNGVIARTACNLGAAGAPPAVQDVLAALRALTP
jgi:heptosyltransferase-1